MNNSSALNYVVVAAVFLGVGLLMGLNLGGSSSLSAEQVRTIVREEVPRLLSAEQIVSAVQAAFQANAPGAGGGLSADEVRAIVQSALANAGMSGPDRFELVDDDPSIGPDDAPVVIVEFSAYACPYCARHFQQTFIPLLENYGQYIRYVYRDYPVINPSISIPAALGAQCANEQGKFWEYHNGLFENQSRLSEDFFKELAGTLGLDTAVFNECYDTQRYREEIDFDYIDGSSKNIGGTPAFFLNGQFISGAQPYALFERLVLRELEKQGIRPQQAQ
ncbi:MAG: DsbA family protein [Anaerolineae bacterium]|nr:DsbA family protein [Anaerolineae bacterium]MDW8172160.1 thioredoxin domain-containing protein [Anaerolineae bacterium]